MHIPTRFTPFPLAHQTFPGLEFFRVASGSDMLLLVTLDDQRLGAIVRSQLNRSYSSAVVCYAHRQVLYGERPLDEAVRWILQHYTHPTDKAFTAKVRSVWRRSRTALLRVFNSAGNWVIAPVPSCSTLPPSPFVFVDRERALSSANISVFLDQLKFRLLPPLA